MPISPQYFKPNDPRLFAGDCMPFSHADTFFLYYLLDEGHHQGLGGLGGHQWALATSRDLIHWEHHGLALPITAEWEGSICTGSVLHHAGQFYAFYATRRRDFSQHLSLAVSPDGLRYQKLEPNPLYLPPPGYSRFHFRDPFAFQDTGGQIHLLVSAFLEGQALPERGGCLAHLRAPRPEGPWELLDPFLIPGTPDVPECADWFEFNGKHILVFSSRLQAHYRFGQTPFGPWERPRLDTFEPPAARVMKTAHWRGRRIGAAWIGTRDGGRDTNEMQWGGHILLREVCSLPDGRLSTRPVEEARPAQGEFLPARVEQVTRGAKTLAAGCQLARSGGLEALCLAGLPEDARIQLHIRLGSGEGPCGLKLRAGDFESGYDLLLDPASGKARLFDQELEGWTPGSSLEIDLTLCGSILDVCLDGRYCLAARGEEQRGSNLWIYALDRELILDSTRIAPLHPASIG